MAESPDTRDTRDTRDTPELDPKPILEALGVGDVTSISPVRGGWDTAIWRVERADGPAALRVFRPTQAASYAREVAAMAAARAQGLPVPEVLAQGTWRERPVVLLEWCPGRTLAAALQERPWTAVRLGRAFGETQARIHAVPAPPELAAAPRAWMEWAGAEAVRLVPRLEAQAPSPPRLLHLDYHPLNVLTDGARITAVLDWTNTRAGDPRADVARTHTILRVQPLEPGPMRVPSRLVLWLVWLGWRRGYQGAAGTLGEAELAPYFAWAGHLMVRDLTPKIGRPGVWLREEDLESVRRWAARWQEDVEKRAAAPTSL
ncbi:MAG TPA: aminoglycoside phosphotransferase family protein [Chloroflexota bacterium]|nr:aminoglycoside phosphotransferase family protein [Chloroflexota bacterium]